MSNWVPGAGVAPIIKKRKRSRRYRLFSKKEKGRTQDSLFELELIPLLQKQFVEVDRIVFLGAGAIPAPVSRCYKSRFLGADKGPAPVNEFSGAGNALTCP